MRKITKSILALIAVVICSCSSDQSLQEYYVDNTENPNFLAFDIPTSLLNTDLAELSPDQKRAYESLRKLNVLAFKITPENTEIYKVEKAKVEGILDDETYEELMKMNTGFGKASIRFKGADDAIDEVIIFGDNKDKGFAIVRVLGKDMNPAHLGQFLKVLEKSDFDVEQFGQFSELFKN